MSGATNGTPVGQQEFREAMCRFPAGVTVVTTVDPHGTRYGFTASAFCSVSVNPPMVLVCIDRSARSFPAFGSCPTFAVSILAEEQCEVARRFATRGADKFALGTCEVTPLGLPSVAGAVSVLDCYASDRHDAEDHIILVGKVVNVRLGGGRPMIWFDRGFRRIEVPAPVGTNGWSL